MSKKIIGAGLALVVILLTLVAVLTVKYWRVRGEPSVSSYTAVYMASGDIYFGKMHWFPRPRLTNVWYLQRSVNQQNQPQLSLAKFQDVFWGPVDEIYLNSDQVLFWTSLRSDSQVVKAFVNPSLLEQQAQPTQ